MEMPRHWRLNAQRYRLEGAICLTCGQPTFPPRPICTLCIAQVTETVDVALPVLPIARIGIESQILVQITERVPG
jgi:Rubredoxin-like zinc ribbon domain (DUF35_N)